MFRIQQFVRSEAVAGDSLPAGDAQLPEFALNYYLPHEVRLNASYGRAYFSESTDLSIWEFGITYRFLFPLCLGGTK